VTVLKDGSGSIQFNQEGTMSMKKLIFFAIALWVVSVTGTLAQDVRYDHDKDKDFSKYKTYKWVSRATHIQSEKDLTCI